MDTSAMTEADKDKVWNAIGKSCIVFEVSTLATSEKQGQRHAVQGDTERRLGVRLSFHPSKKNERKIEADELK
jgi:hypothetical protein